MATDVQEIVMERDPKHDYDHRDASPLTVIIYIVVGLVLTFLIINATSGIFISSDLEQGYSGTWGFAILVAAIVLAVLRFVYYLYSLIRRHRMSKKDI